MSRTGSSSKSTRGIPPNLKPLAEQGERVRFTGFWLGPGERDRRIAHWIDETPNAAAVIKDLIGAWLTGSPRGGVTPQVSGGSEEPEIGDSAAALLNFDD